MLPIPQKDEEENDEQALISSQEEREKEIISAFKIRLKTVLLAIIMFILIFSLVNKKKVSDNDKGIIPEKIKDNNKEKEIIDDNKIKDNQDKSTDNKEEKKKVENTDKDINEKEKENKDKENVSDIVKTDIAKDKTDEVSQKPEVKFIIYLSVIINSFNSKNDLVSLVKNIISKNIDNSEIIISTNYNIDKNSFKDQEKELKSKNISMKYIEYDGKTNTLKMKIDSAMNSNGKYIIFINPEEVLSLDIFNNYKKYIKDNIDIIHYDLDYDRIGNNIIIYQPQLYESLFFGGRDSFDLNHFHVNGKLYKREIFVNAFKNLDKLYLEQSDKYFDEIMIVCLAYQNANTLIKYRQSTSCNRNKCQKNQYRRYNFNNKEILKDTVLFLRFLFECTGKDKVQEKRMAAKIFNEVLISNRVRTFYTDELLNLIKDTINLYLNSDLINDMDKNPIQNYRNEIKK